MCETAWTQIGPPKQTTQPPPCDRLQHVDDLVLIQTKDPVAQTIGSQAAHRGEGQRWPTGSNPIEKHGTIRLDQDRDRAELVQRLILLDHRLRAIKDWRQ